MKILFSLPLLVRREWKAGKEGAVFFGAQPQGQSYKTVSLKWTVILRPVVWSVGLSAIMTSALTENVVFKKNLLQT